MDESTALRRSTAMETERSLAEEAEDCRRLAQCVSGPLERTFLMRAAGEFQRLSSQPARDRTPIV